MIASNRPLSVLVCSLTLTSASLFAAEAVIGKSPFLPPAAATDTAPTPDATLELRGIMATGDSYMFSIYDSTHKSSSWARLNENGHGFVVRSHDATRDSVTVDYQGRTLTLALRTAKVASAPVNIPQPPQPSGPQPAVPSPQPIGGPVVLNPSPADEQRRLEAIAAEVNRRRMIRQQALQASRQANGPQNQNQPGGPNNPSRLPPGVNNQQR